MFFSFSAQKDLSSITHLLLIHRLENAVIQKAGKSDLHYPVSTNLIKCLESTEVVPIEIMDVIKIQLSILITPSKEYVLIPDYTKNQQNRINNAFNQCIIFKKKPNEFHNRANILYQIDSCLIKPLTDCLSDYISNYEAIMLYKDLDEVTQILNKRTNQCENIKVNNNWIIRVNNILSKCDECKCCFKPNNCQDLFGIKE